MPKWFFSLLGTLLLGWCLFSAGLPVAAAPTVSGNISGTVTYQYYEHETGLTYKARFRRLANATVQVLDANDVLLGSGYTNTLGAYSVSINTNGAPTTGYGTSVVDRCRHPQWRTGAGGRSYAHLARCGASVRADLQP